MILIIKVIICSFICSLFIIFIIVSTLDKIKYKKDIEESINDIKRQQYYLKLHDNKQILITHCEDDPSCTCKIRGYINQNTVFYDNDIVLYIDSDNKELYNTEYIDSKKELDCLNEKYPKIQITRNLGSYGDDHLLFKSDLKVVQTINHQDFYGTYIINGIIYQLD
jgi:hypothetical protein